MTDETLSGNFRKEYMRLETHEIRMLVAGMKFKTVPDFSQDGFKVAGHAIVASTRGISATNRYMHNLFEQTLAAVVAINELGDAVAGYKDTISLQTIDAVSERRGLLEKTLLHLFSMQRPDSALNEHILPLFYLNEGLKKLEEKAGIEIPAGYAQEKMQKYVLAAPEITAPATNETEYKALAGKMSEAILRANAEAPKPAGMAPRP